MTSDFEFHNDQPPKQFIVYVMKHAWTETIGRRAIFCDLVYSSPQTSARRSGSLTWGRPIEGAASSIGMFTGFERHKLEQETKVDKSKKEEKHRMTLILTLYHLHV